MSALPRNVRLALAARLVGDHMTRSADECDVFWTHGLTKIESRLHVRNYDVSCVWARALDDLGDDPLGDFHGRNV